jgi:hypothetical protein
VYVDILHEADTVRWHAAFRDDGGGRLGTRLSYYAYTFQKVAYVAAMQELSDTIHYLEAKYGGENLEIFGRQTVFYRSDGSLQEEPEP